MNRMALLVAGLLLAAGTATAQARSGPELEALTKQVAGDLRCPVCQGLSLKDSPTELSMEMKSVIREQLAEGKSPDEVKQYFVGRYGEWILLQPEPTGFNLVVYVLPFLGLLVGAGFVALLVRRWTRPRPLAVDGVLEE